MIIRPLSADDLDGWLDVLRSVAAERIYIATQPGFDEEDRRRRVLEGMRTGHRMWVAEADDGTIVGSTGLHPSTPGVADLGIALVDAARGHGLGRRLTQAALDDAREHTDWHKVTLEVYTDNTRAVAMYARLGFAVEGLRREQYLRADGTRRDALMMALFLDERSRRPPRPPR